MSKEYKSVTVPVNGMGWDQLLLVLPKMDRNRY